MWNERLEETTASHSIIVELMDFNKVGVKLFLISANRVTRPEYSWGIHKLHVFTQKNAFHLEDGL